MRTLGRYTIVIFIPSHFIGSGQNLFINITAPATLEQTQLLCKNGKMQSPGKAIKSLAEWKYFVGSVTPCKGTAVLAGSSTQTALTSWSLQLSDVLSAFIVWIFSCHHLVSVAALFVQYVGDLQRSLSLCSQVQILLSKVGPQLSDLKLEE